MMVFGKYWDKPWGIKGFFRFLNHVLRVTMILVICSFSCYMFLVTLMSPLHQNTFLSWPSVERKSDPSVSKVVQQLGFVDPNLYNLKTLLKSFSRGFLSKSMVMF